MDLTAIQAAISSLQAATGIAKSIVETKSAAEIQSKVIALQSALLEAQNSALTATTSQYELQEKVRSLEAQVKAFNDWGDQAKRYALVNPWRGAAQVYALRKADADGEAAHYLCSNCFHGRKRTIVNPVTDKTGFISMVCPTCRSTVDTGYRGIGKPQYVEDMKTDG
jgi:hypothetical protein